MKRFQQIAPWSITAIAVSIAAWLAVLPEPSPPGVVGAMGWVDDTDSRAPVAAQLQLFADTPAYRAIRTGDEPKEVYLWQAHRSLVGENPPVRNQNPVGSCVAHGAARAIEDTLANAVVYGDVEGRFDYIAEEVIYAGSRVEIGGGRIRGDGSIGAWAAQWAKTFGVVSKAVHGAHDLTRYDPDRCRDWGRKGVPAELEAVARKFPVKDVAKVRTWIEAKRALASRYGIAICSNQGFTFQRDARGICRPSGVWQHCMALDGYHIDADGREYGHITNSWGPTAHTGPVGWGSPNTAGFWADSNVIDRMLRQDDSWAYSAVTGFPARRLDWQIARRRGRPDNHSRSLEFHVLVANPFRDRGGL